MDMSRASGGEVWGKDNLTSTVERELGSVNEIEMATDPYSEKLWVFCNVRL